MSEVQSFRTVPMPGKDYAAEQATLQQRMHIGKVNDRVLALSSKTRPKKIVLTSDTGKVRILPHFCALIMLRAGICLLAERE